MATTKQNNNHTTQRIVIFFILGATLGSYLASKSDSLANGNKILGYLISFVVFMVVYTVCDKVVSLILDKQK